MGSYWDDLSMREKMAFMKVGLDNGLTDVRSIRDAYNKFAAGGSKKTVAVAPQTSAASYIPSLSRKYYAPMNSTPARNTFIPTNRSLGGRIYRRRARKFSGEDDDNPTQLMPFDDSYAESLGTTPISVHLADNVNADFPNVTYDEAMAIKKRMAAMGDNRELVGTMPDIEVIAPYLTPEQSAYIHSPALQLAQQDKPLESVYPEAVLLTLGRAGWTSPSLYKAAWSGAKDLGKAVINPGGVADAMFSSTPSWIPSTSILGATTPAGIAVNALGIGLPAAEAAQYVFSPHGLREANWKSPEPYMQGLALAPLVGAGVGRAATAIPRAWNASLNAFRNRYGFVQTPNSFTRGIGGRPGLLQQVQALAGDASNLRGAASPEPPLTISSDVIESVKKNLDLSKKIALRQHGAHANMDAILYPDRSNWMHPDLNVDYTTSPMTKFGPMEPGWNGFARTQPSEGYPAGIAINANTVRTPTEQAQTLLHEKHHMYQNDRDYPYRRSVLDALEEAYPLNPNRVNTEGSDYWGEKASTNAEIRGYLFEKYGDSVLDPSFNPPLLWKDPSGRVHTVFSEMQRAGYPISAYMNDYVHGMAAQYKAGSASPASLSENMWKAIRIVPALLGGGLFTGAMLQNNTGDATTATNGQIRALGGNLFGEGSYMDPPPPRQIATVGDFSLGKDLSIHSDEHPYIADAINMATGMIPVVGDIQDIAAMIDNPSWANAGQLALDAVSYVPGLRWMKLASKPIRKAAAVESAYKAANKVAPGRQRKAALRKVREENGELKSKTQRKNSAERKAVIENATKKGKKIQTGAQVASGVASGID